MEESYFRRFVNFITRPFSSTEATKQEIENVKATPKLASPCKKLLPFRVISCNRYKENEDDVTVRELQHPQGYGTFKHTHRFYRDNEGSITRSNVIFGEIELNFYEDYTVNWSSQLREQTLSIKGLDGSYSSVSSRSTDGNDKPVINNIAEGKKTLKFVYNQFTNIDLSFSQFVRQLGSYFELPLIEKYS